MSHDENKFENFLSWLRIRGSNIFPLRLESDNIRGVILMKTVRDKRKIIKIPKEMLIHDGMGQNTYFGRKILRGHSSGIRDRLRQILILLFLLEDTEKECLFNEYYKILPKSFDNHPFFWNKPIMSLMKGSVIPNLINRKREVIMNDYKYIANCCPKFINHCSFNHYIYLYTIISSRSFGIRINGVKRLALIPLCDMLNHSHEPNIRYYYDSNKSRFVMENIKPIQKGSLLTNSYGNLCNSKLLINYGFVIPKNIYNEIFIELKQQDIKTRTAFKKCNLYPICSGMLKADLKDIFTINIFEFLRIRVASDEEIGKYGNRWCYTNQLSIDNEIRMLKYFKEILQNISKKYNFNQNYITERLLDIKENTSEYNALTLIQGELNIILYFFDFIENKLGTLKQKRNVNFKYLAEPSL